MGPVLPPKRRAWKKRARMPAELHLRQFFPIACMSGSPQRIEPQRVRCRQERRLEISDQSGTLRTLYPIARYPRFRFSHIRRKASCPASTKSMIGHLLAGVFAMKRPAYCCKVPFHEIGIASTSVSSGGWSNPRRPACRWPTRCVAPRGQGRERGEHHRVACAGHSPVQTRTVREPSQQVMCESGIRCSVRSVSTSICGRRGSSANAAAIALVRPYRSPVAKYILDPRFGRKVDPRRA